MSVYINNVILSTQPTILTEEQLNLQTDQEAIDGTQRRNKYGQKKKATMEFPIMSVTDYRTLISNFTTGSGVYYLNDASNYAGGILSFSGLPSFTEGQYVPGASLFRAMSVTIREI